MSQNSPIEWTDSTWNPVRGCSRVSPGCLKCYAEKVATRFSDPGQPFHLFAERLPKPHWTGRVELVESHLLDPLKWRQPQRIFVNSMSDLFHEGLSDEAIDRVFAVMMMCHHHTFQILTKRADRMREYMMDVYREATVRRMTSRLRAEQSRGRLPPRVISGWPLSNVGIGVSVENQATADARIPLLLQTPAAVRFVSYEPALGPVNFRSIRKDQYSPKWDYLSGDGLIIDWIIVGGESGPGARPFDIEWAWSTVDQCKSAGVACFVKQLGAKPFIGHSLHKQIHHRTTDRNLYLKLKSRKGSDMSEWPEDLRVRQFPSK